jgi:SNF2 family DNA or RNA helicase
VIVHHGSQRAARGDPAADVPRFPSDGLVVTTYGLATRDVDQLASVGWSTVIADEAQFVKNPATKAARALRRLRAGQRIALTGTPVENRLSELWSILDWTNPGMLGSRERFRHRYSKPIERADDSERAAEAAAALRALTRPFVLRRTKADRSLVPDLPDKIEQVAWAGLTREQAVLYQHVVDQLLADAASHTGMKRRSLVLASITKLKQICNHPLNATGDDGRVAGRSGKLARFDELVDELLDVGERALVFTQYVTMGHLLQRHLADRLGCTVPFLSGSVPRRRRDALVASFQAGSGPPLLLVSLKAGGTGLNLTAAAQVIHYDRWWNPAVENQATDRAWRIGQHQVVTVHKLVCEGTIEERIAQLIDDKQALADVVVGAGEAWLSELTTAQLQELVRLDVQAAVPDALGTAP